MVLSHADLREPRSVHIIGIAGAGMSAIAEVLHAMGHRVSGSDLKGGAVVGRLRDLGIHATVGHAAANVSDPDIVVRSTAIPDHNVEVETVIEAGGSVLRRAEILSAIASLRRTVAVAGTHGKTTTSSMLAVIALEAGADPSFIIGGDVTDLDTGAAWGSGNLFVVEADESDGTFLELGHAVGIVTNVEPDHLEHYGGEAAMRDAFVEFASAAEIAVVCADDEGSMALAGGPGVVTYGESHLATYRMTSIERNARGTSFNLERDGSDVGRLEVSMPGMHNARNAAAATTAALEMGIPIEAAQAALAHFGGVGRRFQPRGSARGIDFIDDYAHLPTEVAAALDAAGDTAHARVVAVFQPHRYSRTQAVWRDFVDVFDRADLLVVTDIYSSGEPPRDGVTGRLIIEAVEGGAHPPEMLYFEHRETLADDVLPLLRRGDLCLTLGAGDLVELPDELLDRLQADD